MECRIRLVVLVTVEKALKNFEFLVILYLFLTKIAKYTEVVLPCDNTTYAFVNTTDGQLVKAFSKY